MFRGRGGEREKEEEGKKYAINREANSYGLLRRKGGLTGGKTEIRGLKRGGGREPSFTKKIRESR